MSRSHAQELAGLRPWMLGFARQRLRSREDAEDAVQETLLAALEGVERFSGASSLRTWVGGILKHKIADRMRVHGRDEPLDAEPELPGSDPEGRLAQRRFFEALEASLGRLPERGARVFILREVMGFEPAEVCERLAISLPSCWVSLHRAKARLRVLVPDEV